MSLIGCRGRTWWLLASSVCATFLAVSVTTACTSGSSRDGSGDTQPAPMVDDETSPSRSTASAVADAPSTTVAVTIATPALTAASPPSTAGEPRPAVRHVFPVLGKASYAHHHHDYPASDIIASCGLTAVAPVDGVIVHWRPDDDYRPQTDNPALRGGRSLAVLGDDGVRYYMAHFQSLDKGDLGVGARVSAGQPLAVVGRSGDAGACHVHFGLSPNCPAPEWSVRRGVIWPWPYLDDWRAGINTSPTGEVDDWTEHHPAACDEAGAAPHAGEAD
jgi:murein DD-endopeptidase MepM/ murein hydrolase activator NlpD